MMNGTYMRRIRVACPSLVFALIAGTALLMIPGTAHPQATYSTTTNLAFNVFIPCANDGSGELVSFTATLHTLTMNGVLVHGNLTAASGVGLITGDEYIGNGSPSNLNPAGDGEYLYSLTWIGIGDGAKFTVTAKGPLRQPASEVIQVHCQ